MSKKKEFEGTMFIVASVSRDKYRCFDKRSMKPQYFTDIGRDVGAVVETMDYIKIDSSKKKIEYIPPNPIAIQLDIVEKCISQMKHIELSETFKRNADLVLREKIYKNSKVIYDYISLVQQAIVFGYTALETFANLSIPDDYKYERDTHKNIVEVYDKRAIERWISLKDKLSLLLPDIYKTKSVIKQKFWSSFIEFEKFRHEIIHQKTIDHTMFYRKYFKNDIYKYLGVVKELIRFFYEESKINGKDNLLWPWLSQLSEEIPVIFGAKSFFGKSDIVGNMFEGIKKR